jgi:hypothetical protein
VPVVGQATIFDCGCATDRVRCKQGAAVTSASARGGFACRIRRGISPSTGRSCFA